MVKKQKVNGNAPATQDDLALLGGQLTTRIDGVERHLGKIDNRLNKIDDRLNKIESDQKDILKTVRSIDEQFKEFKTHPTRISRLERSVFHS